MENQDATELQKSSLQIWVLFEEQNMEKAIENVNSGVMNRSQAAKMHSVHRTTLLILSFFGSKKHWRSTVQQWKTENRRKPGLPKDEFPFLEIYIFAA